MPGMSNSARTLAIEVVQGIDAISPEEWDALVPPDDPFCTHAFLTALEASGSASADNGWMPAHVLVRTANGGQAGALVAAAPAYIKDHS